MRNVISVPLGLGPLPLLDDLLPVHLWDEAGERPNPRALSLSLSLGRWAPYRSLNRLVPKTQEKRISNTRDG